MYFDGNPEAWFLSSRYSPRIALFRGLGVRQRVHVKARPFNHLGYAVLADEWGRHERGLDGFDPQATIDGLEFAISYPDNNRSQFIWNVLLAPNKHLLAGVVENSTRQEYSYSTQKQKTSHIGDVASSAAWLPGYDGAFRRPCDVALDDLPPAFRRDEALAAALGMIQPVVEQASRELNVPAHVLRALSEDPALVEMIEKQLAGRVVTSDSAAAQWPDADDNEVPSSDADGDLNYSRELLAAFDKVAGRQREDAEGEAVLSDGPVRNPEFRRIGSARKSKRKSRASRLFRTGSGESPSESGRPRTTPSGSSSSSNTAVNARSAVTPSASVTVRHTSKACTSYPVGMPGGLTGLATSSRYARPAARNSSTEASRRTWTSSRRSNGGARARRAGLTAA